MSCHAQVSVTHLTSHVLGAECGDNYMRQPLPYQVACHVYHFTCHERLLYQEEIEYTRALDDQEGNSFWRPSLLQYQDVTFYLQVGPSKLTTITILIFSWDFSYSKFCVNKSSPCAG